MRLISILTQVLSRALLHRKAYEYPQAHRELEGAYTSMFGMTGELLHQFSDEQLFEMFGNDDESAATKCYVLGSLMKEEGEVCAQEGEEIKSASLFIRALGLLIVSFLMMKHEIEAGHSERIEALLSRLAPSEIPFSTQEKVRLYNDLKQGNV